MRNLLFTIFVLLALLSRLSAEIHESSDIQDLLKYADADTLVSI